MSTKTRNLFILAAVLILSVLVWSAVSAQEATSTVEPPAASTAEAMATAEPMTTEEPMAAEEPSASTPTARPFLGVQLQDDGNGVTIVQVIDGSAAADAGLQVGDIINTINGADVSSVADAVNAVGALSVGDQVTIGFTRSNEKMSVTATLGTATPQQMAQPVVPVQPSNPAPQGRGNRGNGFGIFGIGITYDANTQSWTVSNLGTNNALYNAGLRQGDVIKTIDGKAYDPQSLSQYLQTLGADATVTLNVERSGQTQDIQVSPSDLTALLLPIGRGGFFGGNDDNSPRNFDFSQIMPYFMYAYGNGRLGVTFETIDAQVAQQNHLTVTDGALITAVDPQSPAADAGLQVNDVVTAVDNESVDQEHTLRDRLIAYEPGDTVTLTVLRDGKSQDIQATLAQPQMPSLQGMFPNGMMPFGMPFRGQNGGGFGFPFNNNNPPNPQPPAQATPNV